MVSIGFSRARRANARSARGFTLIELLVVLVILTLLAGIVGPKVMDQLSGAKVRTARVQIDELTKNLDLFKLDVGRYPTTEEGLKALAAKPATAAGWNGPYLPEVPPDPWTKPYGYTYPTPKGNYDIFSYGADGVAGGENDNADIHSK